MTTRPLSATLAVAGLAALGLLAGCSTTRPQTVLPPPAALTIDAVPPVRTDLAQRVGRYNEFRPAGLLDWSPDSSALLVSYLRGTRVQLHRVAGADAPLEPLTASSEPTRVGRWLPNDPNTLVFLRDEGGNEATQVFRLDVATRSETRLTEPGAQYQLGPFAPTGHGVLVIAAPLDRAAGGNAERAGTLRNELLLIDVKTGARRVLATLPGTGWRAADFSPDGRSILLNRYRSASDSEIWWLDVASGAPRKLLPRDGEPAGAYVDARFAADSRRLFVATDRGGEFLQLYRYDPQAQRFEGVTAHIPWDVADVSLSRDRSLLALITNEGGRGVARLFDAASLQPLPLASPAGVNVTTVDIAPDNSKIAIAGNSSALPTQVSVIERTGPDAGRSSVWARADTAGLDTASFQPTEVISWKSFDGRMISGMITRPPKRFSGKRPVLIEIHGGPAVQAKLDFNGRYNYVINEMGIAFVVPNVRGSTGFGKTFQTLDDGKLREDSVKDIGALLDWIAQQPDLDASRVVVQGGSYGGYMTLAVATHYSDRIRGAIDTVGISNFVTFLERTESYRRDLRRTEYGDERDPAMREFLTRISPLTNANKIRVPLYVVHGRNDPRVPVQEAEQIVKTVRANGTPVWSLIAENEGHGFAKKENADYLFYTRVLFYEKFLLQ